MVYNVNDHIKVYFEDGSTVVCQIIDIDNETQRYICSALSTNNHYRQGDRIYIDPDSDKIEKTSLKYTLEDEPSLLNNSSEGVVFIGGDLVGTNIKGEREPYGLDWLEANAHWAVRQIGSAIKLKKLAQEGYDVLAFVAYKTLKGGMANNPSYKEAVTREVNKKLSEIGKTYEEVVDIVRDKGMVNVSDDLFGEQSVLDENKLYNSVLNYLGIGKEEKKQIARDIASEDYYHKVGKIVGVAKFAGIHSGSDREIIHEAYPVNIILKNYTSITPPIDFEEFLKSVGEKEMEPYKNPWSAMRIFNLKLSANNANISYLIDLASNNDVMEGNNMDIKDIYSRLITAKSPPGWSDWIEEQKASGMSDDEAFGIAWKQHNKGTKPPSKEGIETDAIKTVNANLKKYARRLNWKFDKHKSQWSFDEKTGTIDKDEDAISRVAKRLKLLI